MKKIIPFIAILLTNMSLINAQEKLKAYEVSNVIEGQDIPIQTVDLNSGVSEENANTTRTVKNIEAMKSITRLPEPFNEAGTVSQRTKAKSSFTDREIKKHVEQALAFNETANLNEVSVDVKNSIVSLKGKVYSYKDWEICENAAKSAPGVMEIKNNLAINVKTDRSDEKIKQAVKDAVLYDMRVYSMDIKPEVNAGWVTLHGTVDNTMAKKTAEKLAYNTEGVLGVTNQLKVGKTRHEFSEEKVQ